MPTNSFNTILSPILTQAANLVADTARNNAIANHLPHEIPNAIHVDPVVATSTGLSVRIRLAINEAPPAAAFEFGSGIHRQRNPNTYIIAPVNANHLKFPFTITFMPGGKLFGMVSNGRLYTGRSLFRHYVNQPDGILSGDFLWNYVDHPGVEASPYFIPALIQNIQNIRNILGTSFQSEIISRIRNSITNHP